MHYEVENMKKSKKSPHICAAKLSICIMDPLWIPHKENSFQDSSL